MTAWGEGSGSVVPGFKFVGLIRIREKRMRCEIPKSRLAEVLVRGQVIFSSHGQLGGGGTSALEVCPQTVSRIKIPPRLDPPRRPWLMQGTAVAGVDGVMDSGSRGSVTTSRKTFIDGINGSKSRPPLAATYLQTKNSICHSPGWTPNSFQCMLSHSFGLHALLSFERHSSFIYIYATRAKPTARVQPCAEH
ncbi:hypothetical protein M8818_003494 [Zalaria obscura]|uniref:Uncharacterized protein n=1 Tax=Zalaria obscura TaxID=2024903 RepID=A0ACC3SED9_9PEZI